MRTVTMYGIPNCDTVKKARTWLADHGLEVQFHDFKKSGVPENLETWVQALGWEVLVNRKGTTWRQLDDVTKGAVVDAASALALMQAQASVIKRPVVDWGGQGLTVGFDVEVFGRQRAKLAAA